MAGYTHGGCLYPTAEKADEECAYDYLTARGANGPLDTLEFLADMGNDPMAILAEMTTDDIRWPSGKISYTGRMRGEAIEAAIRRFNWEQGFSSTSHNTHEEAGS